MFRDDLITDHEVFLNTREFAALHTLENVLLDCTTRRYTSKLSGRQSDDYDGLHGEHLAVQFRATDYLRKGLALPKEKERVRFDGRMYTVESAENEFGIVRLVLSSYRGRMK